MHKLGVEAPPKILVERYLIEIAKNYNVPYEPDAMVRVRFKKNLLSLTMKDEVMYCVYLPTYPPLSPDSPRCLLERMQT